MRSGNETDGDELIKNHAQIALKQTENPPDQTPQTKVEAVTAEINRMNDSSGRDDQKERHIPAAIVTMIVESK